MDYIDLNRLFIPIAKDKDSLINVGADWGQKYGGWLDWDKLLQHRRVVLLAEALSGKTKELENISRQLTNQGSFAFLVRIEDLADRGFEAALDEADVVKFRSWKASPLSEAWFFLDSVDEARLNRKRFSNALQAFRRELGRDNLPRSFIMVTCRVSDWKGNSDPETINREIPFKPLEKFQNPTLSDQTLLSPIFKSETRKISYFAKHSETKSSDLLVVQLAELTYEQKIKMAEAYCIDGHVFLQAISISGLDAMSERPGDLIDLINYWKTHNRFGSLIEMTEAGILRKLREEDVYRNDSSAINPAMARQGAEQLAAALVFGKTFSLKVPGQEPDPAFSNGAIDPSEVLDDWSQDAVNALVRTGLFAPGTYGRIKFHHRTTQEYLAASWLHSLIKKNCPISEVHKLLFAEPYGVKTVVPTLVAMTAWLSQWHSSICNELINREPAALIVHGDPKSLPISIRENLLDSYARLDATGQLDSEHINYRAAWMFSDPALADAINRAWNINPRPGFRMHLLHFIEQGRIKKCVDIVRSVALDQTQDVNFQLLAAHALAACEDGVGLKQIANQIRAKPGSFSASSAPQLAYLLYPRYINTVEILQVVEQSQRARQFSSEGFAPHLAAIHAKAQSRSDQIKIVSKLADLTLPSSSHIGEQDETTNQHIDLCNGIAELALAELNLTEPGEVAEGTLRLLIAVECAHRVHDDTDTIQALGARIRRDKALNRQLMWAVASRTELQMRTPPCNVLQLGWNIGRKLWGTDIGDIEWLSIDTKRQPLQHERRIAFSAIYYALANAGQVEEQRAMLNDLTLHDDILAADLAEHIAPQKSYTLEERNSAYQRKALKQEEAHKQAWRDFRDVLINDPSILSQAEATKSWKNGLFRLYQLTWWLKQKASLEGHDGIVQYSHLEAAFSPQVAEHYAIAMRQAWRHIRPERPIIIGENTYSTKYVSTLAIDGLNIESERVGWVSKMSHSETKIAIRHVIMSGTIKSEWVNELIRLKAQIVLPEIVAAVRFEFNSGGTFSDILSQTAYQQTAARPEIAAEIFRLLKSKEPIDKKTLQYSIEIVRRSADTLPRKELLSLVRKRLVMHLATKNVDCLFFYLGILALLDSEEMALWIIDRLVRWTDESESDFNTRIQHWLGAIFDRSISGGVGVAALKGMSINSVTKLIQLAYRQIPPRDDWQLEHNSTVTIQQLAVSARNSLLNTLMERYGAEAYEALTRLANEPEFADQILWLRELLHRKAKADADIMAWSAKEVVNFASNYSAPVKNGMQLFRLALSVLSDVTHSLQHADASSRAVLALAENEIMVQQWLGERLKDLSRQRFHTLREPEVADMNEPDFVLVSTAASVQVAIEVKNANMGWSVRQLEVALKKQLAGKYLLTDNRRHGILVISMHSPRIWRVNGEVWSFDSVITHLNTLATKLLENQNGSIEVAVVGINACEQSHTQSRSGSAKVKH
ncbi:MAG: hypothetical protein WA071_00720 [Undibacterium umbellatum]|uniref:hypothetical protein n=1 Tax=Undibacterium umbellatum TaxID=2762300 RepID=UPI003BB4C6A7